MAFTLSSPAFQAGAAIPARYTCDDQDLSPPLHWSELPAGARSLALMVEDPDAPDPAAPRTIWVHWIVYNLPPALRALEENAARSLPPGSLDGRNSWNRAGYGGPCPPIGRHRYFHRLFALDTVLPDLQHPDKDSLEAAMRRHVLAQAELIGTYQRGR